MSDEWSLWIDDEREPAYADMEVARSKAEVRELCEERGAPSLASFDVEMGAGQPNGDAIAQMMVENGWWPERALLHTRDPFSAGAKRLKRIIREAE